MGREAGAERDARHRQRGRSFLVAARSLSLVALAIGCTSVAPIVETPPKRFDPHLGAVPEAPTHAPEAPKVEASPPACKPLDPGEALVNVEVPAIVDAMDKGSMHFHRRLAELVRGTAKAPLRIAIYGDSNMTKDQISGELRRVLQARFGDGGHGFVALGKPWNWYVHTDVKHDFWAKSFATYAVTTAPALDRIYGMSGIAVEPLHLGAKTWVSTVADAPVGNTFSKLELFYLQRPHAGRVTVQIDDSSEELDAAGEKTSVAVKRWTLPDAPHRVSILGASWQRVRLLGVTMEREAKGVVVDSLGVGGSNTRFLTKLDPATTEAMLAERNYDLVIFMLDTGLWAHPDDHARLVKKVIEQHRKANPEVSILVVTPPDHVTSKLAAHSDARVVRLAHDKKLIAEANGTAFFDLREAMGGDRSIVRWSEQGLAWTDYIHFSEKGARKVGNILAAAIWQHFERFAKEHPEAGCP
jgi:hypothetical protein